MTLPDHIRTKIKACIKGIEPDARVILYGSQARGDAREDSDVDLLIILPDRYVGADFVRKKLDISGQLYDLSLALGIDISPFVTVNKLYFSRKTPFTVNIANEGIEL